VGDQPIKVGATLERGWNNCLSVMDMAQ